MHNHHRTARQVFELYVSTHPLFGEPGRKADQDWTNHCGSFVRRLVGGPLSYESQLDASAASGKHSKKAEDAGVGCVHYWSAVDGNRFGHVGVQIDTHGNIAMASRHVTSKVTPFHGLGTSTAAAYTKNSGATYLGWTTTYGANPRWTVADFGQPKAGKKTAAKTQGSQGLSVASLKVTVLKPEQPSAMVKRIAAYLNARKLGHTTMAATTGIRGPVYWRAIQAAGREDGLYGKGFTINGVVNSRSRLLEEHYAAITPKLVAT